MLKDPLFKFSFSALILLWILNQIAASFDFYNSLWWYDIMMHLLGGLWVGLCTLWIYNNNKTVRKLFADNRPLIVALSVTLLVGLLWELFEYVIGVGRNPFMSYPLDTAKDLVDDTIGGIVAGLYGARYVKTKN